MISSINGTGNYGRPVYFDNLASLTATPVINEAGDEIYRAGQFVPAGTYQQVDGPRVINLENEDCLPPSFDGHRAEYFRIERPWTITYFSSRVSTS